MVTLRGTPVSIVGVIQTRVNSTRLPKKALLPIAGRPMFLRIWDRLALCPALDSVVVLTSDEDSNEPIRAICTRESVGCVSAETDADVLGRFVAALERTGAEALVRITSDCPFADPLVIRDVVQAFKFDAYDYASNVLPRSFPDGLDVEVISADAIRWLDRRCHANREEFTRVIWNAPDAFRCVNVDTNPDLSGLRWTVDYYQDLEFARWAYERLPEGFGWRDVLALKDQAPPDMLCRFDPAAAKENEGGRRRSY